MYTNSDVLDNKMEELKLYVNNHKPTIISIAEVKPKNYRYEPNISTYKIEGYTLYQSNIENRIGRGVLLYIHNSLVSSEVQINVEYQECVFADIKLKNRDKLLVGTIYRSDSGTIDNNMRLLSLMKKISNDRKYSHKLIMGDFNFASINWSTWTTPHSEAHLDYKFIETIRDTFFFQHIKQPTRVKVGQVPSTLDLIFTNEENMITELDYNSPLGKSDHCVLDFKFLCYLNNEKKRKMRFLYDKGDYCKMVEDLNIDWEVEFQQFGNNPDEMWKFFHEKLKISAEKRIPHRLVSGSPGWRGKFSVPVDSKCLQIKKKKKRCWQRYMETRDDEKWRAYCKQRNQLRNMTRRLKRDMEKTIAKEAKRNPKKFWNYVKSKTKTRDGVSNLVVPGPTEDGQEKETSNDDEKCEVLLEYFSSVFTKEPPGEIPKLPPKKVLSYLNHLIITEDMIIKKIEKLNISKSPGPDEIHPRILKETSNIIAKPLVLIYNKSLKVGRLPEDWKKANISAIFKKGNRKKPQNYRPISLTCVLCKVLESLIRDHIIAYMKENNLFSCRQFGFITGRSTTLQLLKVLDKWTEILDSGGQVDVVYLDFMKAFDQVPHRRLIGKLDSYGIKGSTLKWLTDFLSDRLQRVVVNGCFSSWAPVTSGIPQGSVLGPVLFVIYINDLPEITRSDSYLFADDTKVYKEIKNYEDHTALQDDLKELEKWSKKWLLNFNGSKCKILSVGQHGEQNYPYKLRCEDVIHELETVNSMKDLGVIMDKSLNFEEHIEEKISKANKMVGIIRRTFTFLDEEMFLRLYKSVARPHLEYANPVWSPYKIKDITALENVQRRATKLVPSLKNLSYEERLRKLDLPTLTYRRGRGDMIETFKMFKTYDQDVAVNFTLNNQPTRGHQLKLEKLRARKEVRRNFYTFRIHDMWNSLPQTVIDSTTVLQFEKRMDNAWKNLDFKFNYRATLPGHARETRNYQTSHDLDIEDI